MLVTLLQAFSPWTTWDFSLMCPHSVNFLAPLLTISTTLVLNQMPWPGRAPILSQWELDSAPTWDIWVSASTREFGVWVPIIVKKELTNVAHTQTSGAIWKAPGNFTWPPAGAPRGLGSPVPPVSLGAGCPSDLAASQVAVDIHKLHLALSFLPLLLGGMGLGPQCTSTRTYYWCWFWAWTRFVLHKSCQLLLDSRRSNQLPSPAIFPPHAPVLSWLILSWQEQALVSGSNMDFFTCFEENRSSGFASWH